MLHVALHLLLASWLQTALAPAAAPATAQGVAAVSADGTACATAALPLAVDRAPTFPGTVRAEHPDPYRLAVAEAAERVEENDSHEDPQPRPADLEAAARALLTGSRCRPSHGAQRPPRARAGSRHPSRGPPVA